MENLKILTLNCWGVPVPFICKLRSQRMAAIAEKLSVGEYDIIALQEVWLKRDYKLLCERICERMPYTHYFYSGVIGSGMCIFSKLPILETFFHRFHLNGHAYKVQHGDWFGGKGVGLCRLEFHGFRINLYITHIHAEYDRANDEYLPHRISQAFEMSQFIRHTSSTCDVVIAAGDFNLEKGDVGYNVLLTNTPLSDGWENKKNTPEINPLGCTCECPFNPFRDLELAQSYPDGKRIDYIMYTAKPGVSVSIENCITTLGMVPGASFSYSDHEAVWAELQIERIPLWEEAITPVDVSEREIWLRASSGIVEAGIAQVRSSSARMQLQALGLAILLLWFANTNFSAFNPAPIAYILGILKFMLAVVVAVFLWLAVVVKEGEVHGLLATHCDLNRLLKVKKFQEE